MKGTHNNNDNNNCQHFLVFLSARHCAQHSACFHKFILHSFFDITILIFQMRKLRPSKHKQLVDKGLCLPSGSSAVVPRSTSACYLSSPPCLRSEPFHCCEVPGRRRDPRGELLGSTASVFSKAEFCGTLPDPDSQHGCLVAFIVAAAAASNWLGTSVLRAFLPFYPCNLTFHPGASPRAEKMSG